MAFWAAMRFSVGVVDFLCTRLAGRKARQTQLRAHHSGEAFAAAAQRGDLVIIAIVIGLELMFDLLPHRAFAIGLRVAQVAGTVLGAWRSDPSWLAGYRVAPG